ncbi:MAG: metallopeptidase family protein [Phycisphaerales bacterium]|nr:metallopeptidase family protein [Phycisphaerales bacterium]
MRLGDADRARFDALVDDVVASLPEIARRVMDRVAVVVLDRPTRAMVADVAPGEPYDEVADELCGLHTGVADVDEHLEAPAGPSTIHLFRVGILSQAGGWDGELLTEEEREAEAEMGFGEERVREEIRITLLHEIGHQYGLDEDDLADLGYE